MTDRQRTEEDREQQARRESQAREEIAFHRRVLEGVGEAQDFASGLVDSQLEARIVDLESVIREREPRLDVTLSGEAADTHRVPAELLGRMVGRLQQGITRIGWAFHAGAGDEREPPAAIKRLTGFDVVALAPSSFRIVMSMPMTEDLLTERLDLDAPELVEDSVEALLRLMGRAQERALDEDMEDLAHRMGKGSAKSVQFLMSDLARSGMDATFDWHAGTERLVEVSPDTAQYLGDWLKSVDQRTREIQVTGTLHGGDDLVGRFKIVDVAENVYEGKADPEVLAGKTFGRTYIALMDEITSIAENVGARTERYILRALRRPPQDGD